MNPIHLIIPMSGQGTRFRNAGFQKPKPLIEINQIPMIVRLLETLPSHWPTHFVLAKNQKNTGLVEVLLNQRKSATIDWVEPHTLGPSFAAQMALKHIPSESPIFISYCDYGMVWDASQFERFVRHSQCDACLVSYRGFHAHYLSPLQYAYSRLEKERVVQVKEKGSFTLDREKEFASTGGYYFKNKEHFRKAFEYQQTHELHHQGEYYTSLTVEALLLQNPSSHVRVFEIPGFFQWGTPQDIRAFEYWEKTFEAYNTLTHESNYVAQLLMPMAGKGSRFRKSNEPKPLIPVLDIPMFRRALDTLPSASRTVLVALDSFAATVRQHAPEANVISLFETPAGQALSTEQGLQALDEQEEVLVSACDHGIVLPQLVWDQFRKTSADAAIFVARGYPGAARNPSAYAYVEPSTQDFFSTVKRISVKKPLSPSPQNDFLLVGSFWFRKASILKKGIEELKRQNSRVNGELYLDSIFDILSALGFVVRMIPLEGYLGWGDPEALNETLYWQEMFCSRHPPRQRIAA